jgi:hypothetical protein
MRYTTGQRETFGRSRRGCSRTQYAFQASPSSFFSSLGCWGWGVDGVMDSFSASGSLSFPALVGAMIAQVKKQLVTARMEDATTGHLHTHEDGTKFSVDGYLKHPTCLAPSVSSRLQPSLGFLVDESGSQRTAR